MMYGSYPESRDFLDSSIFLNNADLRNPVPAKAALR